MRRRCARSGWVCPRRSTTRSSGPRRSSRAGWASTRAPSPRRRSARPVHVENDANLGALAEHRRGVGRGHSELGLREDLLRCRRRDHHRQRALPRRGRHRRRDRPPDRSTSRARCAGAAAAAAWRPTPPPATCSSMMAGQLPGADLDDIFAAAREGNVSAHARPRGRRPAPGLGAGSIVNLLNPELVVVGGDMARAGELLLESARIGLRRHALDAVALTPGARLRARRAGQPRGRRAAGRGAHRPGRGLTLPELRLPSTA